MHYSDIIASIGLMTYGKASQVDLVVQANPLLVRVVVTGSHFSECLSGFLLYQR